MKENLVTYILRLSVTLLLITAVVAAALAAAISAVWNIMLERLKGGDTIE